MNQVNFNGGEAALKTDKTKEIHPDLSVDMFSVILLSAALTFVMRQLILSTVGTFDHCRSN